MKTNSNKKTERLRDIMRDDFKNIDVKSSLKHDWKEIQDFFLNDGNRDRMQSLGKIRRFFYMIFHLLRTLFLKLTSFRRWVLMIGIVFIVASGSGSGGEESSNSNAMAIIGAILMLYVLMLELKDKLLAADELQDGRTVQQALMPDDNPDVPGWEISMHAYPAKEVGGDMTDYLKINDNRHAVWLGDISGKGLGAALIMVKLQATVRALCQDFTSLKTLGTKINEIFYRDSPRKTFASLVYLELCTDSGEIKYFNAGHMPPVRMLNKEVRELSKGAPAFGLMRQVPIKEETLTLASGEYLILYSDGLSEAMNRHKEFFTTERLLLGIKDLDGIHPTKFSERIFKGISRFVGDEGLFDDLSLIVIRRK